VGVEGVVDEWKYGDDSVRKLLRDGAVEGGADMIG